MEDVTLGSAMIPAATRWDGTQLLAALKAASEWLESHREAVDALNVFPVPDGDTGTNMALTLNGAVRDIEPDPSCAFVADRVRYWAMMRGRGNSGIILSQVLRGMAQGLSGHPTMGASELVAALQQASATAYKAVMKPVEGTMLTVIREAAEAAATVESSGGSLVATLEAAVQGAHRAVERTPTLLKTLRDAGVVDAGGKGLFLILEGMLRYAKGEPLHLNNPSVHPTGAVAFRDIHGPDDFGYCTNFLLQGSAMPYEQIRETLATMGQSAVIVGDDTLIKVHIHLLRPGDALNYAVEFGSLDQIEITNMDLQRATLHRADGDTSPHMERSASNTAPLEPLAPVGVIAVAPGAGFGAIFRSLNVAAVVGGGQTMNPSTQDILAAIEPLAQHQVIVLPNNSNIIMTALQAAQLSTKRVEVIPTKTVPQGIAAMLGFNYQADLADNVRAMTEAIQHIHTAEVTLSIRDAVIDGIAVRAGQTIGLLNGELVTAADRQDVVIDELLQRMPLSDCEIITLYYGQAVRRADADILAQHIQKQYPDLEIEVQSGGQPLYDYILSAE